ncbi:MAG: hypothetical protein JWP36_674 [Paucimonas sp.]|jgi:TRAP-type mannitol/chloroaromatic compound transport system permease small subunit|nr:hypothetical protein [Paucimonas sp.]
MHEPGVMPQHEVLPRRGPAGRLLFKITQGFALAGGLLFIALVLMSLVSIVGRKLAAMPVPGDIEMLQMGTAVASAALLPYCEMIAGHLRVDFFTANASPRVRRSLDAISHLLLALVAALIAWRTGVAANGLRLVGETSMMLSWPVWPAWALMVPSFVLFAIAGLYNAVQELRMARIDGEGAPA